MFAKCEGIVARRKQITQYALQSMKHSIASEKGQRARILFNPSGSFEMQACADYFAGKLDYSDLDQSVLDATFVELPRVTA